ncbi:hypothetical protein V2A60_010008 [Cordyceps javanica]|nr:hypothetical protein IF2G_07003 [Cordyceps javanica]
MSTHSSDISVPSILLEYYHRPYRPRSRMRDAFANLWAGLQMGARRLFRIKYPTLMSALPHSWPPSMIAAEVRRREGPSRRSSSSSFAPPAYTMEWSTRGPPGDDDDVVVFVSGSMAGYHGRAVPPRTCGGSSDSDAGGSTGSDSGSDGGFVDFFPLGALHPHPPSYSDVMAAPSASEDTSSWEQRCPPQLQRLRERAVASSQQQQQSPPSSSSLGEDSPAYILHRRETMSNSPDYDQFEPTYAPLVVSGDEEGLNEPRPVRQALLSPSLELMFRHYV